MKFLAPILRIIVSVIFTTICSLSEASITCSGHFINPITDICWSCLMPITIGEFSIGGGTKPKERNTPNPSSPLCMCPKNGIPTPGISIGFWEPVRLVDVTRAAYCMTNLGGVSLGSDMKKQGTNNVGFNDRHVHDSFYHLHYYIYPLIYWLELVTDFICLEKATFDVAYMSEFDPTWNDDKLQNLLNPEAFLFANPLAQGACAIDCASSTLKLPIDSMFWCAGCLGNLYPLSGYNADHMGGVQTSSLMTARIIAKMHRIGLAQETSTDQNTSLLGGGKLCQKNLALKIKKSQYKLQMVNPKSSASEIGCWPLGLSDALYSAFKEYPNGGEDFGYLIWRKKNCCAF